MEHLLVLGIGVAAAAVTGLAGWLPFLGRAVEGARLHLLLGITAGLLLAVALVDLVPEALEEGGHAVGWTMALTFLALYIVEWVVGVHGHGHGGHDDDAPAHHAGHEGHHGEGHFHRHAPSLPLVAFVALALHRLVDGVTLPTAFHVDEVAGLTAGAAVLIHQFPDGLAAASLFLAGGWSKRRVLTSVGIIALLTPIGVLLGLNLLANTAWLPHIIAIAAVTFIFIAVAELMPELHHGPHKRSVAAGLIIGYGLTWLIEIIAVAAGAGH